MYVEGELNVSALSNVPALNAKQTAKAAETVFQHEEIRLRTSAPNADRESVRDLFIVQVDMAISESEEVQGTSFQPICRFDVFCRGMLRKRRANTKSDSKHRFFAVLG